MPQPPADKDRWRRTLEELGLEEDASAPPAPMPQPERPAHRGNLPAEEPRERREVVPRAAPPEEYIVEEQQTEPVEATAAPEEIATAPAVPGEESESRDPRKRRRRRGRRGKGDRTDQPAEAGEKPAATDAVAETEPAGEKEPAAEEGEEDDRPRRGRRRRTERHAVETETEEPAEVVTEGSRGPREEDDDEPVEDMSRLDVPSWSEIIASLYRPDR